VKKKIAIMTLCLFLVTIFAGSVMAKNDKGNNSNGKGNFGKGNSKYCQFKDIDSDWAKGDIEKAVNRGFIKGYGDGTYQPNKPVTSLEVIVMLVNASELADEVEDFKLSDYDKPELLKKIPDWGKAYAAVALDNGILNEWEMKTFNPNQGAKRWQICIYIARILDKLNLSDDYDQESFKKYIDENFIPVDAKKAVKLMAKYKVMNGYPDGSFGPNRVVKRNEMARILNCFAINCIDEIKGTIIKGTLKTISFNDSDNSVTLKIALKGEDNQKIKIAEEDKVDFYFEDKLIDFDDLEDEIVPGGAIKVKLNKDGDPLWVKIYEAAEEDEEDEKDIEEYIKVKGTLDSFDYDEDDQILSIVLIDDEDEEQEFDIDVNKVKVYYDGELLEADDEFADIETGGSVKVVLKVEDGDDDNGEPVLVKISSPDED
jgi:hypothetical protein